MFVANCPNDILTGEASSEGDEKSSKARPAKIIQFTVSSNPKTRYLLMGMGARIFLVGSATPVMVRRSKNVGFRNGMPNIRQLFSCPCERKRMDINTIRAILTAAKNFCPLKTSDPYLKKIPYATLLTERVYSPRGVGFPGQYLAQSLTRYRRHHSCLPGFFFA